MEERKSFLFYRSFWSGGSKLKPRERLAFYDALASYAFTGQETELPYNAAMCWEFAKPLIDSNNKKYADGSKGGRPQKTSGLSDSETTGSESLKNISEEKEKEKGKREGKGERQAPPRRTKKEPQTAGFESLPSGPDRIGYAATEELKKRQIKRIKQAAEQITAQPPPPEDDAETAELKKAFRQSTGQEQNTTPAEQSQPPPG